MPENTPPLTLSVCVPKLVVPRLLLPLPSLVRFTGTVPLTTPAVFCGPPPKPTLIAVLLLACGASKLIEPPLLLAAPVGVPKAASSFSLKASALVTELVTVRGCVPKLSPTWIVPMFTVGLIVAAARR